jgi:all-trans-retinol 13,14-reductase
MGISGDSTYDVIVIGGGLGGLSCALHLAKRGMHVLLLEKQPRVGGYCQSYVRGDYYFDVSQHVLSGLGAAQGFARLLEHLQVLDKLEIKARDPMFASVFPERRYLLPAGEEALSEYLKREFPAERAGIDRYFEIIRRMIAENFELFWTGEVDVEHYFPARYFRRTYEELLKECVTAPRLHGLLGQLWQSTGLPNRLCAATWAVEVGGMHWLTGNYHIVGGGQRLSAAMAETLQEAGGVVRLAALAQRILFEDRAVRGVELESGERFFSRIVVANASPLQTYLRLIGRDRLPRPYAFKLGTMEPSCSLLTLYLGLDRPASGLGIDHHTLFVNHGDDNHEAYQLAMAEAYDRTDFMISDSTEAAGGRSHPHGHGVIQMLEVAPGRPWTTLERHDYDEKKARVRDVLLTKLAGRFPEIARHVDVCELATPRTMERVTRNPIGAVYGWAQTPAQADIYRFGAKSLFDGLYFTGAWSRGGGGGYMGAVINGRVTSREILQREGWKTPEIQIRRRRRVAPREASRPVVPLELSGTASYVVPIAQEDLSPAGDILATAVVRIASAATNRYLAERRDAISRSWRNFAFGKAISFSFFNLKLVIVPGATVSTGDLTRIEVTFTPADEGRGEFCIVLTLAASGKPLLKAQGRGLAHCS